LDYIQYWHGQDGKYWYVRLTLFVGANIEYNPKKEKEKEK
jgi:hypothetical protein